MPGDASTLPLQEAPVTGVRARFARARQRGASAAEGTDTDLRWGAAAMAAIVLLALFVVVVTADRPSGLSPTTHTNFFPRWMAGPLGGLWPSLTDDGTTLRYFFTVSILIMYGCYLYLLRVAPRLPVRWIVAAILSVHVILLLAPPLALTDVFNYINYGRMEVVHHLNPYTTIPIAEPHGDPAFVLSNWHQLLSPYGPLFTLLTFVVVPLGVAGSFWALKAILGLTSLAIIWLVWRCARLLGRDQRVAIVLVGLNPIVLMWGLGGDHNDFLMVLFVMLGFYLLLRARDGVVSVEEDDAPPPRHGRLVGLLAPLSPSEIGAGAAFIVATGVKASGGVLIPVVIAGLAHAPRRLIQVLIGMLLAGVLVGTASLLAFGLHIPDLSTQSRLVTNEAVPNLIGLAVGAGGESQGIHHLMTAALIVSMILCCRLAWRRRETITASGWAGVALLVTLSWVLPWYVLWVLPLAALSSSRRLRVATLVLGVYLIISWAPASGLLWNAIGFQPEKTPLGRLHQRYVRELLN